MISLLLPIARTTFLESLRQPIYFVLLMLSALGLLISTWTSGFSMGYTEQSEVSGDNKMLLEVGMATVFLVGTLIAGFVSTSAISREIENKTVLTIIAKPVPRWVLIVGKFIGITLATTLAVITMVAFLLLAIRHGVMSNVFDDYHAPVITFAMSAFVISFFVGAWGNFFYGWNFVQTASLLLCPLIVGAYVLSLNFGRTWGVESMSEGFQPQILTATACMSLALAVLTSVAVAASTRLGQVMTIVVCIGVLVFGLLSNVMVGRFAWDNNSIAVVASAKPTTPRFEGLKNPGDEYTISLKSGPSNEISAGGPLWYGPNPNGFGMAVPRFEAWAGSINDDAMMLRETPGALVITAYNREALTLNVRNVGGGVAVERAPREGDFIFDAPPKRNLGAAGIWGLVPNLQFFWLLDAVSQNQPVPWSHIVLVLTYAAVQIGAFLSLAVMLFQKRDVG